MTLATNLTIPASASKMLLAKILTDMASPDAYMTPAQSAEKWVHLVKQDKLKPRDYICLETGKLPW
ncbi:hypothetical protein K6Y31_18645 [Motilimonas cestriensis]|uniref:Uncharacterized protein n=1 Tax=Motilimonas cestriensis TaxID=2742685 RepID=A0ABS8WE93_9GAMM|nr:hypothetical protein [Motilimonas cestriensis]MCE2596800.1 hypothetical protein [Motilimonas cestriensis]